MSQPEGQSRLPPRPRRFPACGGRKRTPWTIYNLLMKNGAATDREDAVTEPTPVADAADLAAEAGVAGGGPGGDGGRTDAVGATRFPMAVIMQLGSLRRRSCPTQ